jgi:prolyl oligopeptidase
VAEVRNVPTTYHGTTVDDPYRWLEDTQSAPVQAWLRGQGDAARSVLDRIDGRDAIARRLAELADAQGDSIRNVVRMPGERLYYLKRAPGQKQFRLVMREGRDGAETLLVDPEEAMRRTGVPHAINYFRPSWDGQHVAYGMSAGGSENATLYILHVPSGKLVGEPVPRVFDTPQNWLPDSRSLTYTQLAPPRPGAPATDTYKDARVMWLRLGSTAAPQPVFGPTVLPQLGLDRLDVAQLITAPGSPWVVARTTDTTVPEGKLFVAPLAGLGQPGTRWQRIAGPEAKVVSVALQGDRLVVMTQAGAPRRKIVAVDLRRPDFAQAKLLAAEPKDAALQGFQLTPGGLVTEARQGTQLVLRRHDAGDTVGRALPMPAAGAARLAAHPAHDTEQLIYNFSGWTEPSRYYRLVGDRSVDVALGSRSVPPGLPEVQITDVMVPSHDGVKVPMTILHRKGLALDGRNPVLLNGYASYGFTISANFSTETMAWIESGGVAAFINPRGSGAFGDEWHRAGYKTTKPNTWKDGIAGAKYLIAQGYGSPKTMGIIGGSAGGIFVGRATTEAPELFAAAIYSVGSLDTVRAEDTANGATNVSEFGTVKDPVEFKALLEMSTYHAIKDGTRYPAVLLVHGMNDPRVEVWQSAKTAARLQAAGAKLPDAHPALLRLDMQAGHGVGSTVTQRQALAADQQAFLLWQMGKLGLKD